jgi:hypothetical protein
MQLTWLLIPCLSRFVELRRLAVERRLNFTAQHNDKHMPWMSMRSGSSTGREIDTNGSGLRKSLWRQRSLSDRSNDFISGATAMSQGNCTEHAYQRCTD